MGYLQINEAPLQERVQEEYSSSEKIRRRDANELNEDDLKSAMKKLEEASSKGLTMGTYFINPFERGDWDDDLLVELLSDIFSEDNEWYVNKSRLKYIVRDCDVPDDDFEVLIRELVDRDYIAEAGGYYQPDDILIEEDDFTVESITEKLEEQADIGKMSTGDIQKALSIKATDQFIRSELEEKGRIIDIRGSNYFVNSETAIERRIQDIIDSNFVEVLDNRIENQGYLLTKSDFDAELVQMFNERRIVDEADSKIIESFLEKNEEGREMVLTTAESEYMSKTNLSYEEETDSEVDMYLKFSRYDTKIREESWEIINSNLEDMTDPSSTRVLMEEYVKPEIEHLLSVVDAVIQEDTETNRSDLTYNQNPHLEKQILKDIKEKCDEINEQTNILVESEVMN